MRGLASLLVLAAAAGALLLHGGAAPAAPPPLVFAEGEGLAEARAAGFADLHVAAGGREAALHVAGVPGASVSLGDVLEVRNPGAQDQDVRLRRSTPLDPAVLAFRVEVRDEAGLPVARWDAAASAAAPDAAPDIASDAALDIVSDAAPDGVAFRLPAGATYALSVEVELADGTPPGSLRPFVIGVAT